MLSFGMEDEGYKYGAEDAPELPTRAISTGFGLSLHVHLPDESERPAFAVASAAPATGQAREMPPDEDAQAFVEDLIQLARIDFESSRGILPSELLPTDQGGNSRKTHTLVPSENGPVLKRVQFQCGPGCRHGHH
jgi:hypothetical protein